MLFREMPREAEKNRILMKKKIGSQSETKGEKIGDGLVKNAALV